MPLAYRVTEAPISIVGAYPRALRTRLTEMKIEKNSGNSRINLNLAGTGRNRTPKLMVSVLDAQIFNNSRGVIDAAAMHEEGQCSRLRSSTTPPWSTSHERQPGAGVVLETIGRT